MKPVLNSPRRRRLDYLHFILAAGWVFTLCVNANVFWLRTQEEKTILRCLSARDLDLVKTGSGCELYEDLKRLEKDYGKIVVAQVISYKTIPVLNGSEVLLRVKRMSGTYEEIVLCEKGVPHSMTSYRRLQ